MKRGSQATDRASNKIRTYFAAWVNLEIAEIGKVKHSVTLSYKTICKFSIFLNKDRSEVCRAYK